MTGSGEYPRVQSTWPAPPPDGCDDESPLSERPTEPVLRAAPPVCQDLWTAILDWPPEIETT